MFHRILEAFFMTQVLVEDVVGSALHWTSEVADAINLKSGHDGHYSGAAAGNHHSYASHNLHTFQDLPLKLYRLFRQYSRYLFVSMLGAILGRS